MRDRWSFEVWNEANLDVFWSGTQEEYLAAVRRDGRRRRARSTSGSWSAGPSSAAAQWVEALLEHAAESGAPVDFVSTHTYGSPPLDLRPILARHGREDAKIWWTEWGPGSQHFHLVGDSVFAATFLLDGMASSMGRLDALVALGGLRPLRGARPAAEAQPRRLRPADRRQPAQAAVVGAGAARAAGRRRGSTVSAEGDGAGGLVSALAARGDGGDVGVLVWNSSLDQSRIPVDELLARDVTVTVDGLPTAATTVRHWRVDEEHSNVFAAWRDLGGG